MADPIISNGIRVQSILQGITGLPTDRYVNTWAFSTAGPPSDADLDEAMDAVDAFFNVTTPVAGGSVGSYLSADQIDTVAGEMRAYRLGDSPPRQPRIQSFALTFADTTQGLPAEVAVCSSFYSERSLPSLRGRVFIGPLVVNAIELGGDGCERPLPQMMATLAEASARLAGRISGVVWCVLGRPLNVPTLSPVTGGWVDNAFDTQRRRGPDPTARIPWALP